MRGCPFSPSGGGHGGHGRRMCSATRRLHGLSAGRRSVSVSRGGDRPCRLWHRRTLRPVEARRGLRAAAESGARSGSKSAANSGLCRRGCAGPRPRVHDGAGSCGCDDAGSAGRDADGCAANGRRARAGSESKASACCFGGPRGGSGRRPCAPASSGGCARAGSTCCACARTGRKAGACCFDGAYASTGASTSAGNSYGSAGGARGLRAGRCAARLHARFRRRLRVVVFGQEGLTNAYLVDAAGCIDVPLIGQVLARGATTEELAYRIAAKLRNGFIREPHVAVEVVVYRPFFILGEVTAPGQYPYVPRMTAETAVAIAGGFTPRAFRRNLTVDRPVAGRIVRMSVPPSSTRERLLQPLRIHLRPHSEGCAALPRTVGFVSRMH